MLIHFVHTGGAYLPELQAYSAFVQASGHQAQVHREAQTLPPDAAVLWWMCGRVGPELARRHRSAFHIHEYASASVPPLAWLKDHVKRWRQVAPHYRIYQNDWVRRRMGFSDALPYDFRDMGVSPLFLDKPLTRVDPEFDFVYLGEMRRLWHFLPVFDALARAGRRVLMVGQMPDNLWSRLQHHTNVTVTGRVPYTQVPALLRRAHYGLNLVPDQLPYTEQTSTKLLEYCAAGLRVVSTQYAWVREFERSQRARFAYIPSRASTTAYSVHLGPALDNQPLASPDVRQLAWPQLLTRLQVWRVLGIHS
jgi:glycosyltransferase involved in cell wall biosynthesis